MRSISTDSELHRLYNRVMHHAEDFNRVLPEIRFFILEPLEFASLLEKNVYPVSPTNIWEGKRMLTRKYRMEAGEESALFYEVVQTGDPAYAYLNSTNSPMVQASVMAHVVGHCEFSELNVLRDSNKDRTEYVIHLARKIELGRQQMGDMYYFNYWNACESVVPLIAPRSQYNLDWSLETEKLRDGEAPPREEQIEKLEDIINISSTLSFFLKPHDIKSVLEKEIHRKLEKQNLTRRGYILKAPCQDVLGFLREYAPTTPAEKAVLDYHYVTHYNQDFIMRTQVMNEGWAMYWEKKIMMELFKERAVKGIIDYTRIFSGVCYPRPYFQRNPYHLGYHLWNTIFNDYRDGKISIEYHEEMSLEQKRQWKRSPGLEPLQFMRHLIETITDYEFIRRFLSLDLVEEFHLNRVHRQVAAFMKIPSEFIVRQNDNWLWLDAKTVKEEMLKFFTHFFRPRIYIIDTDFNDGGLLLYHRYEGRDLRKDWIKPTLKNINVIWKRPVGLVSKGFIYVYSANKFTEETIKEVSFEEVVENMKRHRASIKV